MARPVVTRKKKRKVSRSTKGGTTIAVIGLMVLVVVALPLCLVVVAGMLPTIVAAITDRHPKRYLLRSLAALNLAGMIIPVAALLHAGMTVAGAATVLFDPFKWLWMYGGAALGWLCYLGAPAIAKVVVETQAAQAQRDLQHRAKALAEEWGEEVTGRQPQAK
jgi:hypothetical protein